tara:strand:- start:132 stop:452 length:321 start_codon:yes stop_codon:yes gene_type:complete
MDIQNYCNLMLSYKTISTENLEQIRSMIQREIDQRHSNRKNPLSYVDKENGHFTSRTELNALFKHFRPNGCFIHFKRQVLSLYPDAEETANGRYRGIRGIKVVEYK